MTDIRKYQKISVAKLENLRECETFYKILFKSWLPLSARQRWGSKSILLLLFWCFFFVCRAKREWWSTIKEKLYAQWCRRISRRISTPDHWSRKILYILCQQNVTMTKLHPRSGELGLLRNTAEVIWSNLNKKTVICIYRPN